MKGLFDLIRNRIKIALVVCCLLGVAVLAIYFMTQIEGVDRWSIRTTDIYEDNNSDDSKYATIPRKHELHVDLNDLQGGRYRILSGQYTDLFVDATDIVDFDPPAIEVDSDAGQRTLYRDLNLYDRPSPQNGPTQVVSRTQRLEVIGRVWSAFGHEKWFEVTLDNRRVYYAPVDAVDSATRAPQSPTPTIPGRQGPEVRPPRGAPRPAGVPPP